MPGPRAILDRIHEAKRAAIKGWLLDNPKLTIDELIALRGELGDALGELSIAELVADAPAPKRNRRSSARKAARIPAARSGASKAHSKANSAGVDEREAMVLAELDRSGGWVKPQTLVASTGVNSLTLRRALKSLEAQKKVRRKGRARGTLWRAL